tara:strand:+ start:7033 stop:7248 length:216 start_codon:yes stop_codon:yes gene_type:complete
MSGRIEKENFIARNQDGIEITIIKYQPYKTVGGQLRPTLPSFETTDGIKVNETVDHKYFLINDPNVIYEKV